MSNVLERRNFWEVEGIITRTKKLAPSNTGGTPSVTADTIMFWTSGKSGVVPNQYPQRKNLRYKHQSTTDQRGKDQRGSDRFHHLPTTRKDNRGPHQHKIDQFRTIDQNFLCNRTCRLGDKEWREERQQCQSKVASFCGRGTNNNHPPKNKNSKKEKKKIPAGFNGFRNDRLLNFFFFLFSLPSSFPTLLVSREKARKSLGGFVGSVWAKSISWFRRRRHNLQAPNLDASKRYVVPLAPSCCRTTLRWNKGGGELSHHFNNYLPRTFKLHNMFERSQLWMVWNSSGLCGGNKFWSGSWKLYNMGFSHLSFFNTLPNTLPNTFSNTFSNTYMVATVGRKPSTHRLLQHQLFFRPIKENMASKPKPNNFCSDCGWNCVLHHLLHGSELLHVCDWSGDWERRVAGHIPIWHMPLQSQCRWGVCLHPNTRWSECLQRHHRRIWVLTRFQEYFNLHEPALCFPSWHLFTNCLAWEYNDSGSPSSEHWCACPQWDCWNRPVVLLFQFRCSCVILDTNIWWECHRHVSCQWYLYSCAFANRRSDHQHHHCWREIFKLWWNPSYLWLQPPTSILSHSGG